jgi:heat shock protein HslJ
MIQKVFTATLLLTALVCCNPKAPTAVNNDAPLTNSDTTNRAEVIDPIGCYTAVLPCADCEGILFFLKLNSDNSYKSTLSYIGKPKGVFNDENYWAFANDTIVDLLKENPNSGMNKLLLTKTELILLDTEGKRIEGTLADKYKLTKMSPDIFDVTVKALQKSTKPIEVVEKADKKTNKVTPVDINGKWILESINNDSANPEKYMKGLPYLELNISDASFRGSTGCNNMFGKITLKGTEISFSDIGQTKMMCKGNGEREFLGILTKINSYTAEAKKLRLSSGRERLVFVRE